MKHLKSLIKSAAFALLLAIGPNGAAMAAAEDDDKTSEQLAAVALITAMVVAIVALSNQPDPLRYSEVNLKDSKKKPGYDLDYYFTLSPEKIPHYDNQALENTDYQLHSGIRVKF